MSIAKLKSDLIEKINAVNDLETLELLKEMLAFQASEKCYQVSDFEKKMLSESIEDYKNGNTISNDDVFRKNEEWLNK